MKSKVVPVRVAGEDYEAPPVVNLQEQIRVPGRRPLPAEQPDYVKAERDANQSTVTDLRAAIAQDTHVQHRPPTEAEVETSRAESVKFAAFQIARLPKHDLESAAERERRAHEENQDLIRAELLASTRTDAYSG